MESVFAGRLHFIVIAVFAGLAGLTYVYGARPERSGQEDKRELDAAKDEIVVSSAKSETDSQPQEVLVPLNVNELTNAMDVALVSGEQIDGTEECANNLLGRIPVETFPKQVGPQDLERMQLLAEDAFTTILGFMSSGDATAFAEALKRNPELDVPQPTFETMRSSSPTFIWKKLDVSKSSFRFFMPGKYELPEGAPSNLDELLQNNDAVVQLVCTAVGSDATTNTFHFCFSMSEQDGLRFQQAALPHAHVSEMKGFNPVKN